jgi:multidrug resistance protein
MPRQYRHVNQESPLLERNSDDEAEPDDHEHIAFGEDDERSPRAWPRSKKLVNVAIIASMSIISPLASSIISPGMDHIADSLDTKEEFVLASTTAFVLMLGLGPLILAPLSETFGRRPVYLTCFSIFALLQIPAALAPNVATLIALRTLSGFFGSVGIANGGGTINDMFAPSGRAGVYGWYLLGPMLGPVLGPMLGGVIMQRFGWRWVFWALALICTCDTLTAFFFLRESYAPVLLEEEKRRLEQENDRQSVTYSYDGQDDRPLASKLARSFRRPLHIFYQPNVLILSSFQAIIFGTTYTIYAQMHEIFSEPPYDFSTEQIGYLFIGAGLGSVTSVVFLVPQIDVVYNMLAARNKGTALPEYRLPLTNIGSVLIPTSLFCFAWTVHFQTFWGFPIFALYVYGIGQVIVTNTVQHYFIDSFTQYAASAIAAGSVLRSVVGGLSPLFASQMIPQLGYGWGTSVFAFAAVLLAPSPVMLYFYGERLRERFPVSL